MEVKIGETVRKQDYWVMDSVSGEIFKAKADILFHAQKRVNELIKENGYFTYREVMDIITQDWPEDKRAEFFDHLNSYEGWKSNDEYCFIDLDSNGDPKKEGTLILWTDYVFKPEKEDAD